MALSADADATRRRMLLVQDNQHGRAPGEASQGHGLKLHRERAFAALFEWPP